jgi:hydrogenase expression/formation protein HypC
MCIALPARVVTVESGHAWVDTREGRRRVSTALVGSVAPGDWLLVFLDNARSVIDADRAAEVDAMLDMLQVAMGAPGAEPARVLAPTFTLPSALDAAALAELTGQPPGVVHSATALRPAATDGAMPAMAAQR